ncbi:hypothetical protein FACS1894133_1650 [Clostridia bacterium]|nr:hypothetical protein FACS1894133_1650 [Clostridia bacterium]
MSDFVPSSFFTAEFIGPFIGMSGQFTSVTGLGVEVEYETYNEGGCAMPHRFFKGLVPQTLVLEQGTVTNVDVFSAWITLIAAGSRSPLNGVIMLNNHSGIPVRTWVITDALLSKYIGPNLNSLRSELAVSRIEMIYSGCC